jgi:hypothetical protein
MAHSCPECGEACYCGDDIDDCLFDRDEDVVLGDRAGVGESLRRKEPMTMNPGSLLLSHGYAEEALPYLTRELEERPNDPEVLVNLAVCNRQLGNFATARELALQALGENLQLGPAWHNLGMICEDLGEFDPAREAYAAAVSLMPESQSAAINYAYSLMRLERFEEAWPHWMFGRVMTAWKPLPGIPVWQDGVVDLAGKRILVNRDGGYGDGIMFARWLPELERRGAKVTYRVWDSLAPVVASLYGPLVFGDSVTIMPEAFDLQCALMSLPALLGMKTLADVPATIKIGAELSSKWEWEVASTSGARKSVGICWRAEENGIARKHRSIPEAALEPLKGIPGVRFYSLCPHGKDLHRHDEFDTPKWMADLTAEFKDWSDTAAFMANLDLVVSVDTAAAHLAGAMGLPVWILVPHRSDWKWLVNREDSPFYPTARLFRQADPLSWEGVIARVAEELKHVA